MSIIVYPETTVIYGFDEDINKDYCDAHGIPYYNVLRPNGAIVMCKGNVGIGFIYNHDEYPYWVVEKMFADFKDYLVSKGINATIEANDILVDGYKVASCTGRNIAPDYRKCYEVGQIAIYQDMEAIEHICKKTMKKVPKALSDYGITTEEVVAWCEKWFSDYDG